MDAPKSQFRSDNPGSFHGVVTACFRHCVGLSDLIVTG